MSFKERTKDQEDQDQAARAGLEWIEPFLPLGAGVFQQIGIAWRGDELVAVDVDGAARVVTLRQAAALLAKWNRNLQAERLDFGNLPEGAWESRARFYDSIAKAG